LALAAFLAALALRLAVGDVLPPGFPFLTFVPAVLLTAFLCGLWPSVAVGTASGLAAWYLFLPPLHSFALDGPSALALAFFALVVAVEITVIHVMRVALIRLAAERERSQRLADSQVMMFKELQHRVSNNLHLVSSLLALQKATVRDEAARRALDQAAARLALIGKIHRQLHDPAGHQVALGEFLKQLCADVLAASGAAAGIVCLVRAEPLDLPPERTIPLVLIVTELVSNALEHAFAGRTGGTITIDLARESEIRASLTVGDDGAGLAPGFDAAASASLGLKIVRAFAAQIGASFDMTSRGGTVCRLSFPLLP
jgi:two-component sensor histidine kinase